MSTSKCRNKSKAVFKPAKVEELMSHETHENKKRAKARARELSTSLAAARTNWEAISCIPRDSTKVDSR